MKDGKEQLLKPSDLPEGTRLTVFYMPKTKKVEGKKLNYYQIFKIQFHLPDDKS